MDAAAVEPLQSAAIAGAAWGAALAVCLPLPAALVGLLLLSIGQAVPLATGTAPYALYDETVLRLALWLAGLALAGVELLEWRRQVPLSLRGPVRRGRFRRRPVSEAARVCCTRGRR